MHIKNPFMLIRVFERGTVDSFFLYTYMLPKIQIKTKYSQIEFFVVEYFISQMNIVILKF